METSNNLVILMTDHPAYSDFNVKSYLLTSEFDVLPLPPLFLEYIEHVRKSIDTVSYGTEQRMVYVERNQVDLPRLERHIKQHELLEILLECRFNVSLLINSLGGSAARLSNLKGALQFLKTRNLPITAYVNGNAASAGAIVTQSADSIYATAKSSFMWHKSSMAQIPPRSPDSFENEFDRFFDEYFAANGHDPDYDNSIQFLHDKTHRSKHSALDVSIADQQAKNSLDSAVEFSGKSLADYGIVERVFETPEAMRKAFESKLPKRVRSQGSQKNKKGNSKKIWTKITNFFR